jgi:hypothetical protein
MEQRVQQIGFIGTYSDHGAKVDAMALVGEHSVRYGATLRLLYGSEPGDETSALQ